MSDAAGVDVGRRHFLTIATTITGVAGVAAVGTPFLMSLRPSARAQALGGDVEVDVGKLEEGGIGNVDWRGMSVALVRRPQTLLDRLPEMREKLDDPDSNKSDQPSYAANEHRSVRPEFLVIVANCTHLGCVPLFRPDVAPADLGPDWQGGFYCPCHGSRFDMAGRVFKAMPAQTTRVVPPYRFVSDTVIQIGTEGGQVS